MSAKIPALVNYFPARSTGYWLGQLGQSRVAGSSSASTSGLAARFISPRPTPVTRRSPAWRSDRSGPGGVELSFVLTTPAKKPRTECCQPVFSMIAAIVVPLAWRSIPSTMSCLDVGASEMDRSGLFDCFADIDLVFAGGHLIFLVSATASCAATSTSPALRAGREEGVRAPRIRLSPNWPTCFSMGFLCLTRQNPCY